MSIVRDDGVLGGEPRIEGTRVGVRHVAVRIADNGQSPAYVADQLDLSLGDIHAALSYYYDNIEEIRQIEAENREALDRVADSTLKPKERVE